jgi:hypothetical protein
MIFKQTTTCALVICVFLVLSGASVSADDPSQQQELAFACDYWIRLPFRDAAPFSATCYTGEDSDPVPTGSDPSDSHDDQRLGSADTSRRTVSTDAAGEPNQWNASRSRHAERGKQEPHSRQTSASSAITKTAAGETRRRR